MSTSNSNDARSGSGTDPGGDTATLRLNATDWVRRRSRGFAVFLFVNWVVMGWYVLRSAESTVRLIAFPLGLFALLGALSQLRGLRLAGRLPLVEATDEVLRYRRFTAKELREVPWSELNPEFEATASELGLERRDGESVDLPWLSLSDEDRERLTALVRQRLGGAAEPESS